MRTVELNGTWQISSERDELLCPVTVPGSVISGLYAAGKIEHPYYRENEYEIRELFRKDYSFSRSFAVEQELLHEKKVELVCEGLDTLTEIYLNGALLAKTDNMHRTWRFDVKEYLKTGENQIRILFKSVLNYIDQYEYAENKEIHVIASGAMYGNQLIRKAHSMFGWDWGPQLVDAGIWRDIYLAATSEPEIEDVQILQDHADGKVTVTAEITLTEEAEQEIRVTLREREMQRGNTEIRASFEENKTPCSAEGISVTACRKSGRVYEAALVVESPKLWWPNGYGEQPLYDLTVSMGVYGTANESTASNVCTLANSKGTSGTQTVTKTIGLRTLTISQEKDEWGKEFAFMVNGVKIFAMGGDYIPEDAVYPWISMEQIDHLLKSCVRANFNCIRIWGGGYYPSDAFYDLCDQYGLIVWQDFMYACNCYDVTDSFAETIRHETVDNVRRLRHHASLGLWCGNNEIESAWDHWPEYQTESLYLKADYIKLFEEIIPKALKTADDRTFYWPSSPSSGGCFDQPDDHNRGDNHYWDVWHGQKPFSDYQKYYFRFCSEFGFQSFPCMKTVKSFTEEADRNIFSKVMESHQKNDSANGKMLYYLSENFKYPKDFKSLLYITQVLQGMAIKYGVDHWRRHRGRCMGALYWQINDNWPVASWASIDYYGRWKALHYMAKKFYAPVALSIRKEGDTAEGWLANETLSAVKGSVTLRVRDMKFRIVKEWSAQAEVNQLSSGKAVSADLAEFRGRTDLFLEAEAVLEDGTVLTDTDTLVPYKHMELQKPQIKVDVKEQEDSYEITLTSDCFAAFVELDFEDADVIFSDNFLNISGEKAQIVTLCRDDILRGSFENAQDLRDRLIITCVNDTF